MFISTEPTPNPNSLKFLPDCQISNTPLHFISQADAASSSLARKLLNIPGIAAVFFGSNFITITKNEKDSWDILKPEAIINVIASHFDAGLTVFDQEMPTNNQDCNFTSTIDQQIIDILEQKVKPSVAMDGGDISYRGFKDGVVLLELQGACAGCPSSTITLKQGIESMLKYYIPEVLAVEAVNI